MTQASDHAADPATSTSIWNAANGLTLVRLMAVPVLAWLLVQDSELSRNIAAVVFLVASVTDFLDGAIARRYGLITNFGKIADPIADKCLTGVALIGLSALMLLPWWITIVIIVREILVTVIRFWVIEHGVIAASRGGKVKTLAQTIAITMYLVSLPEGSSIDELWSIAQRFAMGIALILTVVTALQYIKQARLLRRRIHGDLQ
jgi:CDP-diacylglycerol---glycerol-3-phosphate 3-phosphatidyltransferase